MTLGPRETYFDLSGTTTESGATGVQPLGIATDGTDMFVGTSNSLDGNLYRIQSFASPTTVTRFSTGLDDGEYPVYHNGEMYVGNANPLTLSHRGIWKVNLSTGVATQWVITNPERSWKPMFRPATGHCYTNFFDHQIREYDDTGVLVATHNSFTNSGFYGGFTGGVWVDDLLYMGDYGVNGQVVVFDPSDGSFTPIIVDIYDLTDRGVPEDVTYGPDGRLYMADRDYGQIWSCLPDGSDVVIDVPYTSADAPNEVVAINAIDGYLYVGNFSSLDEKIYRWLIEVPDPFECYTWSAAEVTLPSEEGGFPVRIRPGKAAGTILVGQTVSTAPGVTGSVLIAGASLGSFGFFRDPEFAVYNPVNDTIYVAGNEGSTGDWLYTVDPDTYAQSMIEPASGTRAYWLAPSDDGNLWGSWFSHTVREYDPDTGAVLNTFTHPNSSSEFWGGVWHEGVLYIANAQYNLTTNVYDAVLTTFDGTTFTDVLNFADWFAAQDIYPGDPLGTNWYSYLHDIVIFGQRAYMVFGGDRTAAIAYNPARVISCYLDGSDPQEVWLDTGMYPYSITSVDGKLFVLTADLDDEPHLIRLTPSNCCWNWVDLGALPDGGGEFGVVTPTVDACPNTLWSLDDVDVTRPDISWLGGALSADGSRFFHWDGNWPNDIVCYATDDITLGNELWTLDISAQGLEFYDAFSIACDDQDTLYFIAWNTSDPVDPAIWTLDVSHPTNAPTDPATRLWSAASIMTTSGFDRPIGLVWHPVDGNLYYSDSGTHSGNTTNGGLYRLELPVVADSPVITKVITGIYPQISRSGYITPLAATDNYIVGTWLDPDNGVFAYNVTTGEYVAESSWTTGGCPTPGPVGTDVFYYNDEQTPDVAWKVTITESGGVPVLTREETTCYPFTDSGFDLATWARSADGSMNLFCANGSWTGVHSWRGVGGRKVFYADNYDVYIRSATYPGLVSLNDDDDGFGPYTYQIPGGADMAGRGMTLGPANELYVMARDTINNIDQIIEFDISDPDDPGTVVYTSAVDSAGSLEQGYIAYNSVDDRIYFADAWLHTGSGYLYTSLASFDRTTWTRTNHFEANNGASGTTAPFVEPYIAISPNGVVWFLTHTPDPGPDDPRWLYAYDPATDTVSSALAVDYQMSPFVLPDSSVLTYQPDDPTSATDYLTYRYVFDGTDIVANLYPIADVDYEGNGPFWEATYGNGGPGEAWAFDGSHLWTYNVDCPALGFLPSVGMLILWRA